MIPAFNVAKIDPFLLEEPIPETRETEQLKLRQQIAKPVLDTYRPTPSERLPFNYYTIDYEEGLQLMFDDYKKDLEQGTLLDKIKKLNFEEQQEVIDNLTRLRND